MKIFRSTTNGLPQLGRRSFLQGASLASASLALPRGLLAQGCSALPTLNPNGHTLISIKLKGGADGLALMAPALDPDYIANRTGGAAGMRGTRIDSNQSFNTRLGFNSRWWLPHGLADLAPIFFARDLALIPGAGVANFNKSHFVAMDTLDFGIPPAAQGHTGAITSGFMARMLMNSQTFPTPMLRGLVASKLASTAFLEAPQSLAIGNVENFGFPDTGGLVDQLLADATDELHDNTQNMALANASQTAFDTIDYLDGVDFDTGLSPVSNSSNNPPPGTYPKNDFGRQVRRSAALVLNLAPPEAIEISLGGWDHHNEEGPNPDASLSDGGTMWTLMRTLARALERLHYDLSVSHPGGGTHMDRVTVIVQGEFGRRVAENGSFGTDHGKGGLMMVLGGKQVNGGIYDARWTQLGNFQNPTGMDVTDAEGDVKIIIDHRHIFNEAFMKLMNLGSFTDVFFPGYCYDPLGIFN